MAPTTQTPIEMIGGVEYELPPGAEYWRPTAAALAELERRRSADTLLPADEGPYLRDGALAHNGRRAPCGPRCWLCHRPR